MDVSRSNQEKNVLRSSLELELLGNRHIQGNHSILTLLTRCTCIFQSHGQESTDDGRELIFKFKKHA